MKGSIEMGGADKRSELFSKLWEGALRPGKVRDDLEQYGCTVSLNDDDIAWLEKKGLLSSDRHERALAANILGTPYISISGECVSQLRKMVGDKNEYSPARLHAGVALWTKHINRDEVRPMLADARDRLLEGTSDEKDTMEAIATDLLTEVIINPKK